MDDTFQKIYDTRWYINELEGNIRYHSIECSDADICSCGARSYNRMIYEIIDFFKKLRVATTLKSYIDDHR